MLGRDGLLQQHLASLLRLINLEGNNLEEEQREIDK